MRKGTIHGHSGHRCKDLTVGYETKGNQQKKCRITWDGESPWKDNGYGVSSLGTTLTARGTPLVCQPCLYMRAEQIFLFLCACSANPAVMCRGSTGSLWEHLLKCAPCPSVNLPSPFVTCKHHHQNGGRAAKTDPHLLPLTRPQN